MSRTLHIRLAEPPPTLYHTKVIALMDAIRNAYDGHCILRTKDIPYLKGIRDTLGKEEAKEIDEIIELLDKFKALEFEIEY